MPGWLSHPQIVYCATGVLLLILLPFCCAADPFFAIPTGIGMFSMAGLSFALARVCRTALPAWGYAVGAILTEITNPLLHALILDERFRPVLLAVPVLALPALIMAWIDVLRSSRNWRQKAYFLSGVGLALPYAVRFWIGFLGVLPNLHRDHDFMVALIWTPAWITVAAGGTLLGSLPERLHRPSRGASAMAICHLIAAVLAPLGVYSGLSGYLSLSLLAGLTMMLCALAPWPFFTRRWIVLRFGGGTRSNRTI